MILTDVCVPLAMSLFLDDVGWMVGTDDRVKNAPSRTGMPRRHVLADYIAIEEVGRAIGSKIGCAFVIGEWDKNNILRHVTDATPWGERWDCSKFLDEKEAEKIRDYVNGSHYIDLALHGLLHECFRGGRYVGGQEFVYPVGFRVGPKGYRLRPTSYIREHFDAFFEIYRTWGFSLPVDQFSSPGGHCGYYLNDGLADVLREYGVRYWCNDRLPASTVNRGVVINSMGGDLAPWDAYDLDPDRLPTYDPSRSGIIGTHWPAILRYQPEKNLEYVQRWKNYFARSSEVFGLTVGADVPACHRQQIFRNHCVSTVKDGAVILDFTEADTLLPADLSRDVTVSVKKSETHPAFEGADVIGRVEKRDFVNYTLHRKGSVVTVREVKA